MAEKVTIMVLKVDLQCPCCYKKVKKILCKFPQIRDQVYNEKANTVTITVVCCSPEKLRDKLCRKGSPVIKSIEIKDPPKPKEPEKPKEPAKPKEPEKPKVTVIEKPKEPAPKPKVTFVEPEKPKEKPPPPAEKPAPPKQPAPAPKPSPPEPVMGPVNGFPPVFPAGRTCCGTCYEGFSGGPCYHGHGHGHGVPPPPQPCFDGYNYGYGHDRPCHMISRCDYYFSEENPQGCSVM